MLRTHRVELGPHEHPEAHSHPTIHLCVVRRGGFREWLVDHAARCAAGQLRVSSGGTVHELELAPPGLDAWIFEFPAEVAQPPRSPYFGQAPAILSAQSLGDPFAVECAAFEALAHARAQRALDPPAWLLGLRERTVQGDLGTHSLRSWALRSQRHPSHVARSFQLYFGRSLGQHLRAARLWRAARRLREGDERLVTIALDLGFHDQAHLSNAFQAKFGNSPRHYRRHAR